MDAQFHASKLSKGEKPLQWYGFRVVTGFPGDYPLSVLQ